MRNDAVTTILKVLTAAILSLAYVYTTFATKGDVKAYVDIRHDNVMQRLDDIHGDVKALNQFLLKKGK